MPAYGDDDYQPQGYQDDLSTDDNAVDPIINEETDDPTEELGVPPSEFAKELEKELDDEDQLNDNDVDVHDDQREYVEDNDDEGLDA